MVCIDGLARAEEVVVTETVWIVIATLLSGTRTGSDIVKASAVVTNARSVLMIDAWLGGHGVRGPVGVPEARDNKQVNYVKGVLMWLTIETSRSNMRRTDPRLLADLFHEESSLQSLPIYLISDSPLTTYKGTYLSSHVSKRLGTLSIAVTRPVLCTGLLRWVLRRASVGIHSHKT